MTHKQLAQLLRQFADLVESANAKSEEDQEPQQLPSAAEAQALARAQAAVTAYDPEPTPDVPQQPKWADVGVDELKTKLAHAGKEHGTPAIRDLVTGMLGTFKTAAKMSQEERNKVMVALTDALAGAKK